MEFFKQVSYTRGVANELKDLLRITKIVLLRGCPEAEPFTFYERLSDELGEWLPMDEDLATGKKTGAKWIEVRYDPQFPLSYRHSATRQPLHTDGSYEQDAPHVSLFYCIKAAAIGGATVFFDSDDLIKALELHSKKLLASCHELPVTHTKGGDSKTRPLIGHDAAGPVLTWNYFRVAETSPAVAELRRDFHQFLEEKVVQGGLCFPCELRPGDGVIFNDERLLHGRNSFIAQRAGDRHLLKCGLRLRAS